MKKNLNTSCENPVLVANSNELTIYEDKCPVVIVDDKKEFSKASDIKPTKINRVYGIISFVFAIFSLFAVMIIAIPTSFNIMSPIITTISATFTFLVPLAFLIISFLVIFIVFVLMMPAPIISLIMASIDGNKNRQKTFFGEFGNTTSLVTLLIMIACMVITLVIYIIPLIFSIIIQIAKLIGFISGITYLISLIPF